MESPVLKLIMVQGPRSGETLEFKPGSKIRIGRVVRGNNVTVKDDGISSKHLVIEFESGKWTIQDLDSSNGTFLNFTMIPPNTPVDLHENDTVKIGDCTTISVNMIAADGQDESVVKPRRNTRRQANAPATASVRATRGRKKAEEPVEILGLEGGEVENQSKVTKRGRGRRKNLQEMPPESGEVQTEGKEHLELERGEIENENKITKKGRGRKKALQEMPPASGQIQIEVKENLEPVEACEVPVDGKENMRPGDESLKNSEVQLAGKEMGNLTMTASVRVTRSRNRVANLELECGEKVNGSKLTRKGRGRKKKLQEMPLRSTEVQIEGREILEPEEVSKNCEVQIDGKECLEPGEELGKNCEVQVDGIENLRPEEAAKVGDVKESCDKVQDKVDNKVEEQKVDLEKLTLGEWFDYMEVYLRKQIVDSTEEMIEEMRRKADKVLKYMIEEKKKKKMGKL